MTPTVDIQGAADLMKIHPKSVQDKIAAVKLVKAARNPQPCAVALDLRA